MCGGRGSWLACVDGDGAGRCVQRWRLGCEDGRIAQEIREGAGMVLGSSVSMWGGGAVHGDLGQSGVRGQSRSLLE